MFARRNGPEAMLGAGAPLGATLINFPTNEIDDGTKGRRAVIGRAPRQWGLTSTRKTRLLLRSTK